jgi:hypothetical protein
MSIEKFNDLIGISVRDLPACSIVPQPSTLPRAPASYIRSSFISEVLCSSFLRANDHNVPSFIAPITSLGGS